jgi:RNA polymerase sigma-70 factor (ECF subfamily)
MGDSQPASEVFSQTIEDFWRGLAAFDHRCTVRTWLYTLARHAAARYRRSPWNRERTGDTQLEELVAATRSRTSPWQRTDVKDKWRELRDTLDPDDRALLVMRVDRGLEWLDVARVMLDGGTSAPADTELARETVRLRKRFQLLKQQLRSRAKAAGLLEQG